MVILLDSSISRAGSEMVDNIHCPRVLNTPLLYAFVTSCADNALFHTLTSSTFPVKNPFRGS